MTDTRTTSPDPLVEDLIDAIELEHADNAHREMFQRAADRIEADSELLRLAAGTLRAVRAMTSPSTTVDPYERLSTIDDLVAEYDARARREESSKR